MSTEAWPVERSPAPPALECPLSERFCAECRDALVYVGGARRPIRGPTSGREVKPQYLGAGKVAWGATSPKPK